MIGKWQSVDRKESSEWQDFGDWYHFEWLGRRCQPMSERWRTKAHITGE